MYELDRAFYFLLRSSWITFVLGVTFSVAAGVDVCSMELEFGFFEPEAEF